MFLINTTSLQLEYFQNSDEVPYGILSHRWEQEEITHQEMLNETAKDKHGYRKVERGCELAKEQGLAYFWVDTCCIDKSSSAELSEAINSMFAWYRDAQICFVYLSDVSSLDGLERSVWFTRGWTLQELIAPARIEFYSCEWATLGTKVSLDERLSQITNIPIAALHDPETIFRWSVAQRMSWAAGRVTTRPEDRAYSLLGIFDINMPLLYGEGKKAVVRLQEEILKQTDDQTIFAWHLESEKRAGERRHLSDHDDCSPTGLLATSIDCFAGCSQIVQRDQPFEPTTPGTTSRGLSISLPVLRFSHTSVLALLNCTDCDGRLPGTPLTIGIFLRELDQSNQHARTLLQGQDRVLLDPGCWFVPRWPGDASFHIDLPTAQLEVIDRASTKPVVCRFTPEEQRTRCSSLEVKELFIRQNPMRSGKFKNRKLKGFRIRRFTPFPRGIDFDPQFDCLVRCLSDWSWDERKAMMQDPHLGDVCRIYVAEKIIECKTSDPPPQDAPVLDPQGKMVIPAMLISVGFHGADEYTVAASVREGVETARGSQSVTSMMADPRQDVQVLSAASLSEFRPEWSSHDGLPYGGFFTKYLDHFNRRLTLNAEIIDGVETWILDVFWKGFPLRCDECEKAISDWQYSCVSCSSPAYDCCADCFKNIHKSKHDARPENELHTFESIRLTEDKGIDKVKSTRLSRYRYKKSDCSEPLN